MTANDPLLAPLQLGAFSLSHRVVMPPTRRDGVALPGSAPDTPMVAHYEQRATRGGLVIAETAYVCPAGHLETGRPGLYSIDQVNRWRDVTDAVHRHGGTVLAHLGYAWDQPDAQADMDKVLEDYRSAAENASDAGFDGIELDASTGSLPAHLLERDPASAPAPLLAIVHTLCAVWEPSRIGIGMSARGTPQTLAGLGPLGLAYLRIAGRSKEPCAPRGEAPGLAILLSGSFDMAAAACAVSTGEAAAIGFEDGFVTDSDLLLAHVRSEMPLQGCGAGYADMAGRLPARRRAP